MAGLTLWIFFLTVTSAVWSTTGSDLIPECTSVCKDGDCPLKLSLLDSEECACKLMFSVVRAKRKVRLKCNNESVTMKLSDRFQPESTLVIKGQDEQLTCYKVEMVAETKINNKNNEESKTKTKKKINIRCSHKDQILVQSMFLLKGNKRYDVNAAGCRKVDQQQVDVTTTRDPQDCKCWTPRQVIIHRLGNSTLMVEWEPFYAHKDVRVRVEHVKPRRDNRGNNEDKDKTLWNYQLCDKKLRNLTFTNFDPGTYVALVGAEGCECMMYTASDRITIEENSEVIATNSLTPVLDQAENNTPTTIIIIVVGVLACIGITALGVACYVTKNRTYRPVWKESDDPRTIIILDHESDNVTDIAESISILLNQPDNQIMRKEQLRDNIRTGELLVLVSLQDLHTHREPTDRCHLSSTITVLTDYTTDRDTPDSQFVVHVPNAIEHPSFRVCRNDAREDNRVLSLRDALRRINPRCDLDCDEYRDRVDRTNRRLQSRDDEIKNIVLLSGFVHKDHNKACLELIKMLQQLKKSVAYAFDETNRKDIQKEGPSQWTLDQLGKADLVVVVVSRFLHKLIKCYAKEKQVPEFNQNLGICAPLAIKQMSMRTKRPKIVYVSFGYESNYLDDIVKIYPTLDSDMRYDLVEARQTVYNTNNTGAHHALKVFLTRLSSDRESVEIACRNSLMFFGHVQCMAAMMANDPKWMSQTYGSMESLASFFSTSEISLAAPVRELCLCINEEQYAEAVL